MKIFFKHKDKRIFKDYCAVILDIESDFQRVYKEIYYKHDAIMIVK